MPADFRTAPRIIHGNGAFEQLGDAAAHYGANVLVVTGQSSMREHGFLDRIERRLSEVGMVCEFYEGVPAEPPVSAVDTGRELARKHDADVVIGLGGGSALDVAKSIAILIHEDEPTRAFMNGAPISGDGIPFIAAPTTFGTGTEVTPNAVLTDPAGPVKKSIRHPNMIARVAVVDPELGRHAPREVKAASGMDALTQAIESYFSIHSTAITESLSFGAVVLISNSLMGFVDEPDNIEAAGNCAHGSLLAGMALANARLGMIHGIAHPLGARYKIAHGKLCGMLLPHALRFNRDAVPQKYRILSEVVGNDLADFCEALLNTVGISEDPSSIGCTEEAMPHIVQESMPSGSLKANPRPVDPENLTQFLGEFSVSPPLPDAGARRDS